MDTLGDISVYSKEQHGTIDRPNSESFRNQQKGHRRVSTQVNGSGYLHSTNETLSPVGGTRGSKQLFRDRTTDKQLMQRESYANSDVMSGRSRRPKTNSQYRIRKIGARNGDSRQEFDTDSNGGMKDLQRIGRSFQEKANSSINHSKERMDGEGMQEGIWDALGQYIAKQLRSGKGVWIPKLGHFTFTGMNVDMAGSTNPQERDVQNRFPVFLIGKDFNTGSTLRTGISTGMTSDIFRSDVPKQDVSRIRPFAMHNVNGIIPKVKINYFEVAMFTSGQASKDYCRDEIEYTAARYANQVRQGSNLNIKIPHIGQLKIRDGLAGVVFDSSLVDSCKGKTAKNYSFTFTGNNWMNNKIYEKNNTNYNSSASGRLLSPDASMKITKGANRWLRQNLALDADNLDKINSMQRLFSPQNKALQHDFTKTTPREDILSGRGSQKRDDDIKGMKALLEEQKRRLKEVSAPKSHRLNDSVFQHQNSDAKSRATMMSHASMVSTISRLPELAPGQLMNLAHQLYSFRQEVVQVVQKSTSALSLRDIISGSKIQMLWADAGYKITIINLKCVVKELGFNWNGKICSIQQLIGKLKDYINPDQIGVKEENLVEQRVLHNMTEDDTRLLGIKKKEGAHTVVDIIKELFYSIGRPLYQIFREYGDGLTMELYQFIRIVNSYSNCQILDEDAKDAFQTACARHKKKDVLGFKEFQTEFGIHVPLPGSLDSETNIIRKVREWMFIKQYSTSCAFERLLRTADQLVRKTLRRPDLHIACIKNGLGLSAPEIDFLFDILAQSVQIKEVSVTEWASKIFDDALNPLQLIREIIMADNMDADDVLFQMKLNPWDEPLEFAKFLTCVRRIDPSFSEGQARALFDKIQNQVQVVEIQTMLTNFCGTLLDTVDYKNQMFKSLYKEIYQHNKEDIFLTILEQSDQKSDGKVVPDILEKIIKRVTGGNNSKFTNIDIRKFVRQLQRDRDQKISYIDLMEKICSQGNKEHNPFKTIVSRIKFFLESNNLSIDALVRRLQDPTTNLVSCEKFTDFLQMKIDKKRPRTTLYEFANYIDVDKDGYVGVQDLRTCLVNIKSNQFFKNNGQALKTSQFNTAHNFFPKNLAKNIPTTKVVEVCKEIRHAMMEQKLAFITLFKMCDPQGAGMVSLGDMIFGIQSIAEIAAPLLEKLFDVMDENKIGMVDFEKFNKILRVEAPSQIPRAEDLVEDSFHWQENVCSLITGWVKKNKLTPIEAFRSFDQDFDGLISKSDMAISIQKYLKVRPEEILNSRMDRLFRILSFYKTEQIQPSDFERLVNDVSPYVNAATAQTQSVFMKSMGGGLNASSTYDWKLAAIQQIGLKISKVYDSLEDSFFDASGESDKVDLVKFNAFVDKHDALRGFNLTDMLKQKLFAEVDPHKKTFLSIKDWINAFQTFTQDDHLMVELKNFLQVQFANSESAFFFFQSFTQDGGDLINYKAFSDAATSLLASRKVLNQHQFKFMFKRIAQGKPQFDQGQFETEFQNVKFAGKQVINTKKIGHLKEGEKRKIQVSKRIGNIGASKWETEIIDKLKKLIKSSGKSIDAVFGQFDVDGGGDISATEFRKAIKMIGGLGLTDTEIDRLMQRVDADNDGQVSYQEFSAKFRDDPDFDVRMVKRANDRLAEFKEKMILYMTSSTDAFKLFDQSKEGRMTYLDWDSLIRELCKLSKEPVPCYSIIKDMFDTIDTRHDQIIDNFEWNEAFGGILTVGPKVSVKPTRLTHWENGLEATQIGQCLARSRKLLIDSFKQVSTHSDHNGEARYVTFPQAKSALQKVLEEYFGNKIHFITDEKLACILRVGQVVQKIGSHPDYAIYDFMKVLNVYRDRYQGSQF